MDNHEETTSVAGKKEGSIQLALYPHTKSLGEFTVRRILPATDQKMVGPFVLLDHIGPAEFLPGQGLAVKPHPHIGIATITYLFEGETVHRDSLGNVRTIQAGAVNLMAAGRGVMHSERSGEGLNTNSRLHGIESWIALPFGQEQMEPKFFHYRAGQIPKLTVNGVTVRVLMGKAYGKASPVMCYSPTLYLECHIPDGRQLTLSESYPELAIYVVGGRVRVDSEPYKKGALLLMRAGQPVVVQAAEDSLLMVLGGAAVGDRHIWWNFVSSSQARLQEAKSRWREGKFKQIPNEQEKRRCDTCTACCDGWLTAIINGASVRPGHPCPHSTRAGCNIYRERPENPCKKFICGWMLEDSPLPEWMRPDQCGAIVFVNFDWNGEKVINAVPVGKSIPQPTLNWLKSYAQQQGRPLIFAERIESDGEYNVRRCFGFGPPAFRKKVDELRQRGKYDDLLQMNVEPDGPTT